MILFYKIKSMLDTGKSLKKKIFLGVFWLYLLESSSRGLTVIQTVILARLLAPEHFGIIGVFSIISAASESFSQTGFKKALVQRKTIDSGFLNTAWTVCVIRGVILFVLVFLASPLVVKFFNTPEALPVIRVMAIGLLLQGLYNVGIVYFSRDLEFHKEFFWKINGFLANFLISVTLAFILRNEWAIVWGFLGSTVANLLFSFLLHSYRPQLKFNRKAFHVLFGYGKWLLFSAILIFFSRQGDKIIVTKLMGTTELGIYLIALRFAMLPELLLKEIKNALFPAYSKFQENLVTIKRVYLKTLNIIAFISIPLVGGMIILARPFISIFLGDKWIAAVSLIQILTIASLINLFTISGMSLFNALGKTRFSFKVNFTWFLALGIFIYPLATYYGIIGVAACFLLRSLAGLLVWKREIYSLIKIKITDLSFLIFPVLNTLFFVSMVYYLDSVNPITRLSHFLGAICLGVITYFSLGIIIHKFTRFKVLAGLFEIVSHWKSDELEKREEEWITGGESINGDYIR